jgi:mRNA interferase RelE/StbE
MSGYAVKIAPAAQRTMKKLEQLVLRRIVRALEGLATDPRPSGVEKISQDPRFWRIRVGDYRTVYWVDDDNKIIVVVIVRHRKDAYRDLDKLDPQVVGQALAPFLTGIAARS